MGASASRQPQRCGPGGGGGEGASAARRHREPHARPHHREAPQEEVATADERRRRQELEDEALARRLVLEDMMATVGNGSSSSEPAPHVQQSARAVCPFCGAQNNYRANTGSTVSLQCGACRQRFQVPASSGGGALHICRRCGTMNQFPAPAPGSPMPDVQCGTCGTVTPSRRPRQSMPAAALDRLLSGPVGSRSLAAGPMVRVSINGQPRMVPLALLLALMAEEHPNSASATDIDQLPTRKLKDNDNLGEQTKCLICLEEFNHGDDIKTLPCLHFYHEKCVSRWLNQDNSCPVCKTPIGQ